MLIGPSSGREENGTSKNSRQRKFVLIYSYSTYFCSVMTADGRRLPVVPSASVEYGTVSRYSGGNTLLLRMQREVQNGSGARLVTTKMHNVIYGISLALR